MIYSPWIWSIKHDPRPKWYFPSRDVIHRFFLVSVSGSRCSTVVWRWPSAAPRICNTPTSRYDQNIFCSGGTSFEPAILLIKWRFPTTICKILSGFFFQERFDEWQLTKGKAKEVASTLEPYVAIDVDEVAVERTSTKQKTKGRIIWCEETLLDDESFFGGTT